MISIYIFLNLINKFYKLNFPYEITFISLKILIFNTLNS